MKDAGMENQIVRIFFQLVVIIALTSAVEASTIKGDLDGNGKRDLMDTVVGLQVLSTVPTDISISDMQGVDVNGDNLLGLAEIIYSLTTQSSLLKHFFAEHISDEEKIELNDRVLNSATQPSIGHPRLFGANHEWQESLDIFDDLDPDCEWQGSNYIGHVKNVKSLWDRYTLGSDVCDNQNPLALTENSDTRFYLVANSDTWDRKRALRVLHLIRRVTHCNDEGGGDCRYTLGEIETLSQKFLDYEFSRLRAETKNSKGYYNIWHKGYRGEFFDLGSLPAFKLWCLVLDIFWDSPFLKAEDKNFIEAELENEINSYIAIYNYPPGTPSALGRWALYNGNNWTTILNAAATYWAITFWYEKPEKAQDVLSMVLETNWLHRDMYLNDGGYEEGPTYIDVSMNGLNEMNALFRGSFTEPVHAMKWGVMAENTAGWMLENMSPDLRLIDFGDAWNRLGFSGMNILSFLGWQEYIGMKPYGSQQIDSCLAKEYFAVSYYSHHFYDPWGLPTLLARNWSEIASHCDADEKVGVQTTVYPDYQLATIRTYLPGATQTGAQSAENVSYSLADQTFLALNAVSNTFAHREVDFGALIWTAYGNRLLYDFGYGELSSSYNMYTVSGSRGYYVMESDADMLEFYIRKLDNDGDFSKLKIGIRVHYVTKELYLDQYVTNFNSNWSKVTIPLKDFGVDNWRWSAIRGEEGAQSAQPGVEFLYVRTNGAFPNGSHIGLDEIQFVNGNDTSKNVFWYGDSYSGSIEPGAYSASASTLFGIDSEETAGGAAGSDSWLKLRIENSGRSIQLYYSDDPDDRHVSNLMDFLPVGANTLILPNAKYNGVNSSNLSQFKGETGSIEKIELDGLEVTHMDGSIVYGSEREDGNLEYFHRYTFGTPEGHFIVIDSFKTKPGRDDHVQEFWYTKEDLTADDTCSVQKGYDTALGLVNSKTLQIAPTCNNLLQTSDVESAGRIIADSLRPGSFQMGAPDFMKQDPFFERFIVGDSIRLKNRLGSWESRRLSRYVPDTAVSEDVRVFLLQSATGVNQFSNATVNKVSCSENMACFEIHVGNEEFTIELGKDTDQYILQSIK